MAEECIVHSAVWPHKHDTREEKHIFPSCEARGQTTPPCPTAQRRSSSLPPGQPTTLATSPPLPTQPGAFSYWGDINPLGIWCWKIFNLCIAYIKKKKKEKEKTRTIPDLSISEFNPLFSPALLCCCCSVCENFLQLIMKCRWSREKPGPAEFTPPNHFLSCPLPHPTFPLQPSSNHRNRLHSHIDTHSHFSLCLPPTSCTLIHTHSCASLQHLVRGRGMFCSCAYDPLSPCHLKIVLSLSLLWLMSHQHLMCP